MEDKLDTQESFMDKTDSSLRFNRKNSLGIEEESKDSHRRSIIELSDVHPRKKDLEKGLLDDHEQEDDEGLTLERVATKMFPQIVRRDKKKKKTYIDQYKLDFAFMKELLDSNKKDKKAKKLNNHITSNFYENLIRKEVEYDDQEEEEEEIVASNGLSYNQLKRFIDENHPRDEYLDIDQKIKRRPFPLCTPTGMLGFKNVKESSLLPYGIGIALYFKYMKYLIYLFVILFLLNVPVILTLMLSKNAISDYSNTSLFTIGLFSLTFGNLGKSQPICSVVTNDTSTQGIPYETLTFTCPEGMRMIEFVGVNLRATATCNLTAEVFATITNDTYTQCSDEIIQQTRLYDNCYQQRSCQVTFPINNLPTKCSLEKPGTQNQLFVSGYAVCEEFQLLIPGFETWEKRNVYNLFIVIDLLSIILYTTGYFWITAAENLEIDRYKKEKLSPEKYTIKVANVGVVKNIYLLMNELIDHFNQHFKSQVDMTIADINLVFMDKKLNKARSKLGKVLKKITAAEFLLEKAEQSNITDERFKSELVRKHFIDIVECQQELEAAKKHLAHVETNEPKQLKYVFITFNNPATASYLIYKFQEDNVSKLLGFDREEFRYYRDNRIRVTKAPPPTNLQWNNLGTTKLKSNIRKYFIVLLEFIYIVGSFYILMYYQIKKINYQDLLTPTTCPVSYQADDVGKYWNDKRVLQCYCEANFKGDIDEQIEASRTAFLQFNNYTCSANVTNTDPYIFYQHNSPCYDYFTNVKKFKSVFWSLILQYGVAGAIAAANGIGAGVVLLCSKLMKRPTISSELKEAALGVFLVQVLNTGWIMFLGDLDSVRKIWTYFSPPSLELFKPMCNNFDISNFVTWKSLTYKDFEGNSIFTVQWFVRNGTALMVTVFTCGVTYQLGVVIIYIAVNLYRWWDRGTLELWKIIGSGFVSDMKNTRKLLQTDYNNVYKGPMLPLDNSYSNFLTVIFVILMYSAGLPILYLFGALSFFIQFWVDKYMTLRFCSNPPRLDEKFVNMTRNLLPYSLLFHLAIAILIYGSIELAPTSATDYQTYFSDFILTNSTNTNDNPDEVVNDFVADIIHFYSNSLNRPITYVFGWCTAILFSILFFKFFMLGPLRGVLARICKIRTYRLPEPKGELKEKFVEVVGNYYLAQKIKVMRKQKALSTIPDDFKEKYEGILQLYVEEAKKRKGSVKLKKWIKGNPFYGTEFQDQYMKKFGLIYEQKLISSNPEATIPTESSE